MSTYGGDSWVPEAQYRKRRVDELLAEEIPDDEALRMSNGRYACLVCPHRPVLDTMPMLHVHRRGARHRAAGEKQLFKKQRLHDQIQKGIALGKAVVSVPSALDARRNSPLFTATKDSKAKMLGNILLPEDQVSSRMQKSPGPSLAAGKSTPEAAASLEKEVGKKKSGSSERLNRGEAAVAPDPHMQQYVQEERKRREQELRLQESGWKRDGTGGWYRDENAEFDSDEETRDLPQ